MIPKERLVGRAEDIEFFGEIMNFYEQNKRKIKKSIYISRDKDVIDFCIDHSGTIKYDYICKLAFVFADVLGSKLPDHILTRMILGPSNEWVAEYMEHAKNLKPPKWGLFNQNRATFKNRSLSSGGWLAKRTLK